MKSSMCLLVLVRWSCPRMTFVISMQMSSTTFTKWKTGVPFERKIGKSFSSNRSTSP